jgi:hypothetical protein
MRPRALLAALVLLAASGSHAQSPATPPGEPTCGGKWAIAAEPPDAQLLDLARLGEAARNDFRQLRGPRYDEAGPVRFYPSKVNVSGAATTSISVNAGAGTAVALAILHEGSSETKARQIYRAAVDLFRHACDTDTGGLSEEKDEVSGQPIYRVARLAPGASAELAIMIREPFQYGPTERQYSMSWFVRKSRTD